MIQGGHPLVADFPLGGAKHEAIGSNNWVVDGSLTATGKPLLANDPLHLGTQIPSICIYRPYFESGGPSSLAPRCRAPAMCPRTQQVQIAWGATSVAAGQDLYRGGSTLQAPPPNLKRSLERMTVVPETITVKGADAVVVNVASHATVRSFRTAINANNAESKKTPRPPVLEPLAFLVDRTRQRKT